MSDFIAGAFVGIVQTFVGHPFDTAKVLLQNKTPLKGLYFFDFYRGWKFPLVSGTFFNFTVFPIYERTYNYTNSSIMSGVISGVAVTPIVYIFDISAPIVEVNILDFNSKDFFIYPNDNHV